MSISSKIGMVPIWRLPTTDCVRRAISNVIQDVQREHDLNDQELAEKLGVHLNTVARARNKLSTLDTPTLAKIGAIFGACALEPYMALCRAETGDHQEPLPVLAETMASLARAKGPKAELDALPAVKDCIEALSAWALDTERKRLRLVG